MKVTACLNPLHTALAIFGCLLDFSSIAEEMEDNDLLALVKNLAYGEALPVVKHPKIIEPEEFVKELLTKRLPNKNIPDTPQRIAADTSQKIPVRFGVTIGHYLESEELSVDNLEFIPLVIAAWCRYLLGKNDNLEEFTLSPDPLLEELQAHLVKVTLDGNTKELQSILEPLLKNKSIFPNDLYTNGLADKVEKYFASMIEGRGAIRSTLQSALKEYGNKF